MDALKSTVCLNCGGEVEISADGKEATCKYCRRTYKIGEGSPIAQGLQA